MPDFNSLEILFIVTAFLFQLLLITHFALRKWRFTTAIRFGPFVYALSLSAALASILLLAGGKPWWLWLGGFLYLAWGIYGYVVEYVQKVDWRTPPIPWPIFIPYVLLYLATVMFYWFPLAQLWKPLWYAEAILFIVSTILNVTSHQSPKAYPIPE